MSSGDSVKINQACTKCPFPSLVVCIRYCGHKAVCGVIPVGAWEKRLHSYLLEICVQE